MHKVDDIDMIILRALQEDGRVSNVDLAEKAGISAPPCLRRLRNLEDEYRRGLGPEAEWTPERLRSLLKSQLRGDELIVVSNREPYIHDQGPDGVILKRPASGLVTAVEPVMRACSGTWIAHGSGNADRDTVDKNDRVDVPPDAPAYRLRRLWLLKRWRYRRPPRSRQTVTIPCQFRR